MNILLSLKSKNKQSLYLYLCYFYTFISKQLKFNYTLEFFSTKTLKYFVSLLKSSFIYKEAQEHHGFTLHKAALKIFSIKNSLLIYFLKKINIYIGSDIYAKKVFSIQTSDVSIQRNAVLKSNNFIMFSNTDSSFLKSLDLFGETFLKKSLSSSAGRAKD